MTRGWRDLFQGKVADTGNPGEKFPTHPHVGPCGDGFAAVSPMTAHALPPMES
jgi:hypothetical protein